jgi:hypothetical protein
MSRIDVVIRGAGVVVVAGVLAAGGAYVVNEGGGGSTANIWVDTSTGDNTCVDDPSLVVYDSTKACSTLDAANDIADNGDIVNVKGGSYGAQTMTGSNSRTSLYTVSSIC